FGTGNIEGIEVKWSFSEYIGTVTTLLFWMGLSFETPLLMYFLTKLHILNPQRVASFRKYALILAFVVGAIITPTRTRSTRRSSACRCTCCSSWGCCCRAWPDPRPTRAGIQER